MPPNAEHPSNHLRELRTDTRSPADLLRRSSEEKVIRRDETILLANVDRSEAIVSSSHAKAIAKDIKEKGQNAPIIVRARFVEPLKKESPIIYDIIDGYHRAAKDEDIDEDPDKTIEATVFYGMSDQEMYHQRLIAVHSVKSVSFARLAKWVTQIYESTTFHQKGIPIDEAFRYGTWRKRKTLINGLEGNENPELREWVDYMCERWGRTPEDMMGIFKIVKQADPKIVERVRVEGSKKEAGTINRADITIITKHFPNKENFGVQQGIVNFVEEYNLTREQLDGLLTVAATQGLSAESTPAEIKTLLKEIMSRGRKRQKQYKQVTPGTIFQSGTYQQQETTREGREKLLEKRINVLEKKLKEAAWWDYIPKKKLTDEQIGLLRANAKLLLAEYIKEHNISPQKAQALLREAKAIRTEYLNQINKEKS